MALELVAAAIDAGTVRQLRRPVRSPLDKRWATAWYAELRSQNHPLPCWIEDVSADGAKLRIGVIPAALAAGDPLSLVLPNFSAIAARVAWRRGDHMGMQFCESQPWILDLVLRFTQTEDWFPTVAH